MKRLLRVPARVAREVRTLVRLRLELTEATEALAELTAVHEQRVRDHMACLRVAAQYQEQAERAEWALSEFTQPNGDPVEPLGIWEDPS